MGKKKLLLLLFACFSFALVTKAQTLITSTTASTTVIEDEPTKSGRVKGFVLRPELGVGYSTKGFVTGLNGTFSYQFNPYFSLGAGYGWDLVDGDLYRIWFGNLRAYFCDRRCSPYYDLRLGKKSSSTFGLQVKGFDFSLSASLLFTRNYYNNLRSYFISTFNFAYNIQFGKKE